MKKFLPKKAFSLIELSIVILIIGILVAGVTQSSRLVSQMKLSSARSITKSSPVAGITDLVLWWETTSEESFSDAETSDNALVSNWYDINPQSTVKNVASQATDARKPIYVANAINGLPALMFTRTSDTVGTYLARVYDSSFHPAKFTVFVVVKTKTLTTGADGAIFNTRNNASGSNLMGATLYAVNTGIYQLWLHSGSSYGNNSPLSTTITLNTPDVLSMSYDGANMNFYDGGVAAGSPQARPFTPATLADFRIGIGTNGTGAAASQTYWPYDGYIGEIIMFSRVLKSEERKSIEQYLGKKWGIKIS